MSASFTSKNTGFTLIELVIVVALTIMLLLTASTVFMTFLISRAKISSAQTVKQEGRYATSQMEFLFRNAIELLPNDSGQKCASDMSQIRFRSIDGGTTTLESESDGGVLKIASNSGIFLTSDAVDLIDGPTFDCQNSDDQSRPHINVSFTLRKGTPGVDQVRDIVEETFSSSATLRSF